ncbi:hypothetical protein Lal_00005988 [Lupinus albus]|nr:hypothetical protein Lal_00005988 [Lupinus albus]
MVGVEAINIGLVETIRVTMINDVSQPITIHCKDKKNDLGYYTAIPGDVYTFRFDTITLIPVQLWFCSFNWTTTFHSFDIYDQKRDECENRKCTWNIKKEGPCRQGGDCYPWSK